MQVPTPRGEPPRPAGSGLQELVPPGRAILWRRSLGQDLGNQLCGPGPRPELHLFRWNGDRVYPGHKVPTDHLKYRAQPLLLQAPRRLESSHGEPWPRKHQPMAIRADRQILPETKSEVAVPGRPGHHDDLRTATPSKMLIQPRVVLTQPLQLSLGGKSFGTHPRSMSLESKSATKNGVLNHAFPGCPQTNKRPPCESTSPWPCSHPRNVGGERAGSAHRASQAGAQRLACWSATF